MIYMSDYLNDYTVLEEIPVLWGSEKKTTEILKD